MAHKNIGALLTAEGGQIIGILTERDCTRKLVAVDCTPRDTPVRDIVSSPAMHVRPQHTSDP